jgi:multidrug/hemolysin transport system permease protein
MTGLGNLIRRNCKIFFKDKAMFFTSLITPAILLILYATFLANVFKENIVNSFSQTVALPEKLINGFVGGQIFSSILAVSCVTVSFCSNMLMVQDKVNGVRKDLLATSVKGSTLAISYFVSSLLSTLIIGFVATGFCFLYLGKVGWYLSATDIAACLLDVVLLSLFGTALSSVINGFLHTQGQISAVGTIVSSVYGFICGAYMPMSQFGTGLQHVLLCLPGTYGTSLIRNHALNGTFREMERLGMPKESIELVKTSVDCNLHFAKHTISIGTMYAIMLVTIVVLIVGYIEIHARKRNQR